MRIGEDTAVESWLVDNLDKGATVAIDPWCIYVETAHRWKNSFSKKGQTLIQQERNMVDEIWKDQPSLEVSSIFLHPLEYSGCSVKEKLNDLRRKLALEKAEAIILTALNEVSWLYNICGSDVAFNHVVHAFRLVTTDSTFIYEDQKKVTSEVVKYMTTNEINIRNYEAALPDLNFLSSGQFSSLRVDTVFNNDMLQNEDLVESRGVENEANKSAYSEDKGTLDGETHKLNDTKCNQSKMEIAIEKPVSPAKSTLCLIEVV